MDLPSVGEKGSMKLGVTHMGGGHFALNGLLGVVDAESGEAGFSLVRGSAEEVDGRLRMSLDNTTAEKFANPETGATQVGNGFVVFNLTLDPDSLDGGGYGGGVQTSDLTEANSIGYLGNATVNKASCRQVAWE